MQPLSALARKDLNADVRNCPSNSGVIHADNQIGKFPPLLRRGANQVPPTSLSGDRLYRINRFRSVAQDVTRTGETAIVIFHYVRESERETERGKKERKSERERILD